MQRRVNNSYMTNLELRSLHYWFKNARSQNSLYKYDTILKLMQDSMNKCDIPDIITIRNQQFANIVDKSQINFHERVILRNIFEHWKLYVVHKLHTRRATYKATYFYHKKLQKNILNALSRNVLLKWQHIVSSTNKPSNKLILSENHGKSEKHYSKVLLGKYFKHWGNYLSIMKRKKKQEEIVAAHNNFYCLKKCIVNWKMYMTLQQEEKIIREKVDEARKFYRTNILRKIFNAWINIRELILQRNQIEHARTHYGKQLLNKYFSSWIIYHNYKRKKLEVAECVFEFNRRRLLNKYFIQFVMSVNECLAEKVKNEDAEKFYNHKLAQKVFLAWQDWYNRKVENTLRISEIRSILEVKQKRVMLTNWRMYVIQRKCGRRKTYKSRTFYAKKLASKALRKLHEYALYRKEKRAGLFHICGKRQEITKQLQIIYIDRWRMALYSLMQEKQKLHQAIRYSELKLTRAYFANWREFSRQYKMKMIHKRKLNDIATSFLAKKFLLHWHAKLQDVLVTRKKEISAIRIMEHKIKKKYFLLWKEYIARKIQMNNDIEAAMELHNKILLREGLKEILRFSLRNNNYQRDMQLEAAATRSFENMEILKEYFDKWYSLIYTKKKTEDSCTVKNSNVCQIKRTLCDNFRTCLVLPEYMMEKNKLPGPYNSFTMNPRDWSLNFIQSV